VAVSFTVILKVSLQPGDPESNRYAASLPAKLTILTTTLGKSVTNPIDTFGAMDCCSSNQQA
jgi:hypothetical protein